MPPPAKSVTRNALIDRILVAVDASPDSRAALRAAVQLAEALGAEVEALYVEDVELVHLPRLPFGREIDFHSGKPRRLGDGEIERQMRVEAARLRRILARMARELEIHWSFRSARGRVAPEVLSAARTADLLILGARGRSPVRAPGSTVRAVVLESTRPVMVLRRGARLGRTIDVLFDGSPEGREALAVAVRLAAGDERSVVVLVVPDGEEVDLHAEARDWLAARELRGEVVSVPPGGKLTLASRLHGGGRGPVVIPRTVLGDDPGMLSTILRGVERPLVVVGGERE